MALFLISIYISLPSAARELPTSMFYLYNPNKLKRLKSCLATSELIKGSTSGMKSDINFLQAKREKSVLKVQGCLRFFLTDSLKTINKIIFCDKIMIFFHDVWTE